MPSKIASPILEVPLEPLTQSSFSPFGHVIANPSKQSPGTTANYPSLIANQGSATKFLEVTDLTDYYHDLAPSKKPARPSLNIFSCRPRPLRTGEPALSSAYPKATQKHFFDVKILERHPHTSQTFVPLGRAGSDRSTQYLVIVAPTLAASAPPPQQQEEGPVDGARPRAYPPPPPPPRPRRSPLRGLFARAWPSSSPFTDEAPPPDGLAERRREAAGPDAPRGPGMPDLRNLRAFLARGDQAVTYGPGTWHAPMVVLGREEIDFLVVQYVNGVGAEDCQEVELEGPSGSEGLSVRVDGMGDEVLGNTAPRAKL